METINPSIHQTFQPIFSKNPTAASTWSEDNTPRETSIRHCFWGYYAYVSDKKQKSIKSPSFSTEHCPVPNSIQYALGGMEVNMGNIRETFFANQLFKPNEVFVFGSNLAGMHGGGAARIARMYFGAVMGNGDGMQASLPTR